MIQQDSVIVKEFPSLLDPAECRRFLRELRVELADSYRPQVVFDLSRVQHMSAQGVDLLVRCIDQIADRDGEVKFAAASPQTELVLELTQISAIAACYESVEDAVEVCEKPANARQIQPEPVVLPQAA